MPEYLITLRPPRDGFAENATEAERAVVGEHFAYLTRALAEGILILAGRTQEPTPVGLVIIRARDRVDADRFAANDPAVRAGLFRYELMDYAVALMEGREP